jgi:putative ABC transport system permease protein
MGRDVEPAPVDQPHVTDGTWVREGGVVLEAAFADALDVGVGDTITLEGRTFDVVGVAVTAALPPYPELHCLLPCTSGGSPDDEVPEGLVQDPGLVWLTRADVADLADPRSLAYVLNLRLADPTTATTFVAERSSPTDPQGPYLRSWEEVLHEATELARDARVLLMIGAWLLGLLAVASVAVLVGGRMAEQTRRVGLLKAVGATPGLVGAVLLAEYEAVALLAAVAALVIGTAVAPALVEPGAGLVGTAGSPPVTPWTVGLVVAVALGLAAAATFVPAARAARTSTVDALADAARPPRRIGWLLAVSARLPGPLLLAVRIAARRPRRVVLGVVSVAITVSGVVVALVIDAYLTGQPAGSAGGPPPEQLTDDQVALLRDVLLVVAVMVLALAAVNAVFLTWTTVVDNRHASALARALGSTPHEVDAALAASQALPALVGAVLGAFPGGYALFHAINAATGGDGDRASLPPVWQLAALVAGTVLVVVLLTAVPAHLGGRRSVAETLRVERA